MFKAAGAYSGSRITLEHSLMHHFGTQPFSIHFGTQNDTYHQNNANHTDMRFTDRPNTLEAWRVLKQEQDKKKKTSYEKYSG